MLRSAIFLGFLACIAAEVTVIQVQDIEQFKVEYPDAIPLQKLEDGERKGIQYYIGARAPGDRLLGQATGGDVFAQPSDIAYQVNFNSFDGKLTYVNIMVQQSTNLGRAYIQSGGLGQAYAVIIVEAYATDYVFLEAQFFGK